MVTYTWTRTARHMLGALLAGTFIASGLAQTVAAQPAVTTLAGKVVGQYAGAGNDVAVFFGVPYAQPPIGSLRFSPPEPLAFFPTNPFVASNNSIACEQATPSVAYSPTPVLTEDCLIMNIWAPANPGTTKRPVMFWIHGGGGTSGNSNPYKGIAAVEAGKIVLVTVNYRLNSFGFVALPGLDAENVNGSSGNQAVQDLTLALHWVHDNIGVFGGDPNNVTVFGVSQGANMIASLLGAPAAGGLFQKGIMESLVGAGVNNTTRAQAETSATNSIHSLDTNATNPLGCLSSEPSQGGSDAALLACLRALPAVQALRIASPGLTTDGVTVPLGTNASLSSGAFNRVPMIVGSNQNEGTFFSNITRTEAQYHTLLTGLFPVATYGAAGQTALVNYVENTLYPSSNYPTPDFPSGSPSFAAAIVTGDNGVVCNAERARGLFAPWVPVYGYEFAQPNPVEQLREPFVSGIVFNDGHTTEEAYDFDIDSTGATLTGAGTAGLNPGDPPQWGNGNLQDVALSKTMVSYWTTFAATARPNNPGGLGPRQAAWPAWLSAAPAVQLLINNSINSFTHAVGSEANFSDKHNCGFWASPTVGGGTPANQLIAPSGPN